MTNKQLDAIERFESTTKGKIAVYTIGTAIWTAICMMMFCM